MKHYCPYNTGLPAFITHYVQGHTYYEKGCGDNKLDILFKGLIQHVCCVQHRQQEYAGELCLDGRFCGM